VHHTEVLLRLLVHWLPVGPVCEVMRSALTSSFKLAFQEDVIALHDDKPWPHPLLAQ